MTSPLNPCRPIPEIAAELAAASAEEKALVAEEIRINRRLAEIAKRRKELHYPFGRHGPEGLLGKLRTEQAVAERVTADLTLPLVRVVPRSPQYSNGQIVIPAVWSVQKVTPKRIYLRQCDVQGMEQQHDREGHNTYGGHIDLADMAVIAAYCAEHKIK